MLKGEVALTYEVDEIKVQIGIADNAIYRVAWFKPHQRKDIADYIRKKFK